MLAAVSGHELEARINPELMQSVLEITTPVCRTAGDIERELVSCARTSPGSRGSRACASARPERIHSACSSGSGSRRRTGTAQLIDQMQYVARRELIFGMHVHVAVDDPEKAIQVVNGLLPHLAPLLALSASSPFWRGEPTASPRAGRWSSPHSRAPGLRRGSATTPITRTVVGQLERSGCIADYTHIWWDIRLHPRLGTIEIRICDAVTRVEDAIAIAAYCQALVKQLCEQHEAGQEIPSYHRILTSENKWLAARYGLEAPVMDLASGRRNRVPVARLIRRTVAELLPHARELGSERELEGVLEILARGSCSDRQLRIYNANRDIVEVAREIAEATEALPAPSSARPRRCRYRLSRSRHS